MTLDHPCGWVACPSPMSLGGWLHVLLLPTEVVGCAEGVREEARSVVVARRTRVAHAV